MRTLTEVSPGRSWLVILPNTHEQHIPPTNALLGHAPPDESHPPYHLCPLSCPLCLGHRSMNRGPGLQLRDIAVPSRFGNLLRLRNLSLAGNKLESIPPSFGNLLHLDRVVLDCNSLHRLPETLGRMKCRWLNVSNNKLVKNLRMRLGSNRGCSWRLLVLKRLIDGASGAAACGCVYGLNVTFTFDAGRSASLPEGYAPSDEDLRRQQRPSISPIRHRRLQVRQGS